MGSDTATQPPKDQCMDEVKRDLMDLVGLLKHEVQNPQKRQDAIQSFVQQHPLVELAYVTNPEGVQNTPNAVGSRVKVVYGGDGFGVDRSGRTWFSKVARADKPFQTQPYVSVATLRRCVTLAAPVKDDNGELLAVVAVDIRCPS